MQQPADAAETSSTEAYCLSLLQQERSLEELQNHLRRTEELFRLSTQRKAKQLDALQAEVRRLKSNVSSAESEVHAQFEERLSAAIADAAAARKQLAHRDAEIDALASQNAQLKSDLADERAWRQAEKRRVDEIERQKSTIEASHSGEIDSLQGQLLSAEEAARRLQSASAEAEAALEQALREREAELERLRARVADRDSEDASDRAAREIAEEARAGVEHKIDELTRALASKEQELADEQFKSNVAEAGAVAVEAQRKMLEKQLDRLQAEAQAAYVAAKEAEERARVAEAARAEAVQTASDTAYTRSNGDPHEPAAPRDEGGSRRRQQPLPQPPPPPHGQDGLARRTDGGIQEEETSLNVYSSERPEPAHQQYVPAVAPSQHRASLRDAYGRVRDIPDAVPEDDALLEPPEVVRTDEVAPAELSKPELDDLTLQGGPTMSHMLTATANVRDAGTVLQYVWFRGASRRHQEGPHYLLTADDVGHEISVRVTPVSADGELIGAARRASSETVRVAPEVPHKLAEWVGRGERKFEGLVDAEGRERMLLITLDKVKVRDRSNKTVAKEKTGALFIEAGPDEVSFALHLQAEHIAPIVLRSRNSFQRDLISLTHRAFVQPSSIHSLFVSDRPGEDTQQRAELESTYAGHDASPPSSMASDTPDLSDVVRRPPSTGLRFGASTLNRRALSFGRKRRDP